MRITGVAVCIAVLLLGAGLASTSAAGQTLKQVAKVVGSIASLFE